MSATQLLAASIGAAGHVELELLVEAGSRSSSSSTDPARESFGLSDGEFAELSAGAGDGPTPER